MRYIDAVGYIDYKNFLKLPNRLINTIYYVRAADSLREYKQSLLQTKDNDLRFKLNQEIDELEKTFK